MASATAATAGAWRSRFSATGWLNKKFDIKIKHQDLSLPNLASAKMVFTAVVIYLEYKTKFLTVTASQRDPSRRHNEIEQENEICTSSANLKTCNSTNAIVKFVVYEGVFIA